MVKFWITFISSPNVSAIYGLELGFGVTAKNSDHAIKMIREKIFKNAEMPLVKAIIENFDIKDVDKKHVYLNMGNPELLGIWYPLGYDQFDSIH